MLHLYLVISTPSVCLAVVLIPPLRRQSGSIGVPALSLHYPHEIASFIFGPFASVLDLPFLVINNPPLLSENHIFFIRLYSIEVTNVCY